MYIDSQKLTFVW